MQIFGRDIRRRLPPMVKSDRRRIEMIYSLALVFQAYPYCDVETKLVWE